jgi:peptide/nickel transport system substrate-binding protein
MDEQTLRHLTSEVEVGQLSRRRFTQILIGLGLTAPMAAQILGTAGAVHAQPKEPVFTPRQRGGGGPLRTLWWQAPTLLNPHFATGTKDIDASRIFYEPLVAYDPEGNLVPVLAAELPSVANGGLAKDGTTVTWRLKKNVRWHDGKPFSADDVIFTWEFVSDPGTAAVSVGSYREISRIDKVDSHAIKITFSRPQPFWADAFCGNRGMILPKHVFENFKGAKSREAPANLKPVGTGAYRITDFRPGDVVKAELNPSYHVPNWPFFDSLEMKGGGDAASAARAVLQTGEYDYAWNLQVEDDILLRMEQGGKGRVNIWATGNVEHTMCNFSDPWTDVDGERSSAKTTHPFLTDPAVRQALNLLVDRSAVQEQIYGRQGQTSANFLNAPSRVRSSSMRWEFNVDKANQVLDAAGWKRAADGVRAKDGKRLKMLYQTATNAPRQKTQQIVKQAAAKVGIEIEIKSVVASVFFGSDAANPDNYPHFYADLQMLTEGPTQPDAQYFMNRFTSWEIASKANKWQGRNVTRWRSDEYDRLYRAADEEMDPVKRAAMFVRMNDLVIQNVVTIPVLWRNGVSASTHRLRGMDLSGWDSTFWRLPFWYRAAS